MVTTALELPGYRIVRNLGVVRGIIVRSRSVIGNMARACKPALFGGNITLSPTCASRPAPRPTN